MYRKTPKVKIFYHIYHPSTTLLPPLKRLVYSLLYSVVVGVVDEFAKKHGM